MSSFVEALLAATGALVYGLGVWALMVVDSTGGERLDLLPALYQGLRFFILDPYGMPSAGWSAGHIAFWCALFGAPALLAGKLIDLTRLLFVHAGHSFWPSGWFRAPPVVICGFGAHGRSIASACVQRGHRIIVVDTLDVSDGMGFVVVASKRFRFVRGDFTTSGVLRRAETQRAIQVWFCAGDPNVNLRAAQAAVKLTNSIESTAKLIPMVDSDWEVGALSKWRETWPQIEPFIQFKQAALALVNRWQAGSAGSPPATGVQRVAVIGFGRLGKAVLDELALRSLQSGIGTEVSVVDPGAEGKVASWKDRHQMPLLKVTAATCIAEQYSWPEASRPSVAFICTSEDHANLKLAHQLQRRPRASPQVAQDGEPNADKMFVILRMHDSEMALLVTPSDAEFSECGNVHAVSLDRVTIEAAEQRLPPRP